MADKHTKLGSKLITTKSIPLVTLEEDKEYPFTWKTDRLGVAEFIVCPVYKYGKLVEFNMFSAQQEEHVHYQYKFDYKPIDWSISAWTHKGIEPPRIWLNFWCKEHKSSSFRFYVPKGSTYFTVSTLSNFSIDFSNEALKGSEGA